MEHPIHALRAIRRALALASLALAGGVWAQGIEWLVTPEEVAHADTAVRLRSRPAPIAAVTDPPSIEVLAPSAAATLNSPFEIRLRFEPAPDAQIVPATLRIRYGMFGLDITDRVLKKARLSASGLEVEEAHIPSGSHYLKLSIRDDHDREGEREFRFVVE